MGWGLEVELAATDVPALDATLTTWIVALRARLDRGDLAALAPVGTRRGLTQDQAERCGHLMQKVLQLTWNAGRSAEISKD